MSWRSNAEEAYERGGIEAVAAQFGEGPETFYRTTYSVVVLSEEPIPDDADIVDVMREATDGAYVADVRNDKAEELNAEQMADALHAAGSTPDFFQIEV